MLVKLNYLLYFFLCSSENKDTITTWWANELTWEIKHFLMHYWLIEIRVFCSGRFCYGSVCWTSPLLHSQLCQIPALLNFHLLYPPWPRGQMEMDVLCSLGPLWHEDVRHRNRILQERCGCLLCSRELTAEVPASSHSPRNGMDGIGMLCLSCHL